mmetsp:Transcript_11383/g.34314  ORF Transcript_11383/g.34314 Transcript_11383/m.34314 type:complete len:224 (-) Transcript_11383:1321-1992(-)
MLQICLGAVVAARVAASVLLRVWSQPLVLCFDRDSHRLLLATACTGCHVDKLAVALVADLETLASLDGRGLHPHLPVGHFGHDDLVPAAARTGRRLHVRAVAARADREAPVQGGCSPPHPKLHGRQAHGHGPLLRAACTDGKVHVPEVAPGADGIIPRCGLQAVAEHPGLLLREAAGHIPLLAAAGAGRCVHKLDVAVLADCKTAAIPFCALLHPIRTARHAC